MRGGAARLLIAAQGGESDVGRHFLNAARSIGLEAHLMDTRDAFGASYITVKYNWWVHGKRPPKLRDFSQRVLAEVRRRQPECLLTTGFAPVLPNALEEIRNSGVHTLNYSTDDPWNPVHFAPWFMETLPYYDTILSTRKRNLGDFRRSGCSNVDYLPFGYAPEIHFPESPDPSEIQRFTSDVTFVGAADKDRLPYAAALMSAGVELHLYGRYWSRNKPTKSAAKGMADARTTRKAIAGSKVALCLVRRANRDDSSMRSFEVPAMLGCPLVEWTEEHESIFGGEGDAAMFFSDIDEMVTKAKTLIANTDSAQRLAHNAHQVITSGRHRYADRLRDALEHTPLQRK